MLREIKGPDVIPTYHSNLKNDVNSHVKICNLYTSTLYAYIHTRGSSMTWNVVSNLLWAQKSNEVGLNSKM